MRFHLSILIAISGLGLSMSAAQIPLADSFPRIATFTKKHIFVEIGQAEKPPDISTYNLHRLLFLEALVTSNNSPPNLEEAFKTALKNARVESEGDTIRIIDKTLSAQQIKVLKSNVDVKAYTGGLSDLLASIAKVDLQIFHSRSITANAGLPPFTWKDFALKSFTFKGDVSGFLAAIAMTLGPAGSYSATFVDDHHLSVQWSPGNWPHK